MKQVTRLLRLVYRNPGLTATGYTKLMGFTSPYKPATILKELHRLAKEGKVKESWEDGMITGKAWRFYKNITQDSL